MMRARDNPFAVEKVLRFRFRPEFAGTTWEEIFARLRSLRFRGAVIGPEGSGKTTFLEDLAPRLIREGFQVRQLWLNRDEHPPDWDAALRDPPGSHDFILFDGAEQLTWLGWRRFLWRTRNAGGLVVTGHQSARLPVFLKCRTSPELLEVMTQHLLKESDLTLDARERERLFHNYRGNIREAIRGLYDGCAAGIGDTARQWILPIRKAREPIRRETSCRRQPEGWRGGRGSRPAVPPDRRDKNEPPV